MVTASSSNLKVRHEDDLRTDVSSIMGGSQTSRIFDSATSRRETRHRFRENTEVFTSAKFARDTWTSNSLRKRKASTSIKSDITNYARSLDRNKVNMDLLQGIECFQNTGKHVEVTYRLYN